MINNEVSIHLKEYMYSNSFYNYIIYNDYEEYIGYIQLSKVVLLKYHPRAACPRVILLQNNRGQLYISYIHQIVIVYKIYVLTIFSCHTLLC